MIKLIDLKVKEYLDLLQSQNPAPGSNAANALSGAQAMALLLMLLEKYKKSGIVKEEADIWMAKATGLYKNMAAAIDRDVEATYLLIQEKKEEAIQEFRDLSQVAFDIMNDAYSGLQLAQRFIEEDLPVEENLSAAVFSLIACVKSAWISLKSRIEDLPEGVQKDSFRESGAEIYEDAERIAEMLCAVIEAETSIE